MAGSGALILSLTAGFTFISDEWDLVLLRPGWSPDVFLAPFHEHIVVAPALIFKLLQSVFGMDSPRPMQIVAVATFLATGLLLFIWLRSRVGDWAALIGAVIVLFLGAAFEDLLWTFQIGYFGSLACGTGVLIALDRDDRKGDIAAAILLAFSLSFSSLGMPFVIGAGVEWLLNPRERRRRWFVPGAALILYALWWLGWGHDAESALSISNLPDLPKYVFDAASAGMTSMLGLATGDGSEPDQPHLIWGRLALIALIGLAVWRLVRLGKVPRGVWITGAIAIAFFGLAALGQTDLRPPTSSRYQLPAVIFILLFSGEILRGLRIPNYALALAALVVAITSLNGVDLMRDEAEARWKPSAIVNQTSLGAIAIAGEAVRDDYTLQIGLEEPVPISRFREEVAASGSPGYSADEIQGLDPALRGMADSTMIDAIGIEVAGVDPGVPGANCQTANIPAGSPVQVNPSMIPLKLINPGREVAQVMVSRFGDPPGSPVGSIYSSSWAWLTLPPDSSTLPWQVTLSESGRIRTCRQARFQAAASTALWWICSRISVIPKRRSQFG